MEDLRSRVYQAIESERQKGAIRNALDAEIEITLKKDAYNSLKELSQEIHKFFIASKCTLVEGKSEKIKIKASANEKCSRCWHREEKLNSDGICVRCEDNINGDGETRSFF